MSSYYIKSYFDENSSELTVMADQINNGLNKNEVQLVEKSEEKLGFFEKFFQLFG